MNSNPLIVPVATALVTALVGLLVWSIGARVKLEATEKINAAAVKIEANLRATLPCMSEGKEIKRLCELAENAVSNETFIAWQKTHSEWSAEVIARLDQRIDAVETMLSVAQENSRILAQIAEWTKKQNHKNG